MKILSSLRVSIFLAALGACSPYNYATDIALLDEAVRSTRSAVIDGYRALRADTIARQNAEFELDRPALAFAAQCGASSILDRTERLRPPCYLIRRGSEEPHLRPVYEIEAAAEAKVRLLERYVSGLRAASDAADRRALDAAVTQLAGAVSGVAAAAGTPEAAAAAPVVRTLVQGGGIIASIALDTERFNALRRSVRATDPHVRVVATSLGANLDVLRLARIEELRAETRARASRLQRMTGANYSQSLAALQDRLATLNALRATDATSVARGIADAHAKLRQALDDPQTAAADFADAVAQLANAAQALREALTKASPQRASGTQG